ncbi:MAG: DNA-binding CsgD family transcriptional regulator [Halioglobus sp.]|jgi:DNA-binding CsgD family transcriptional regulator
MERTSTAPRYSVKADFLSCISALERLEFRLPHKTEVIGMTPVSICSKAPLALAVSAIHRCRTVCELQKTFLDVAPNFVDADAWGMYVFDVEGQSQGAFSGHADQGFLREYERWREHDPLLKSVIEHRTFTHSLGEFARREWLREPLHRFLSQWGLDYSIEAPLIVDGEVRGTLNFALGGREYFGNAALDMARFLCGETDVAFTRIIEREELSAALQARDRDLPPMGKRAREVLELALRGLNNRVIASRLAISENTVRHHIKRLYTSLDVHNRAELVNRVRGGPPIQ